MFAFSSLVAAPWAQANQNEQPEWNAAALMDLLAGVQAADLTFTELRVSGFLYEEIELTGRMIYRAPDRIEKFVETPFVENIKISGDQVSIEKISDRGNSQVRTYSLTASEALRTTVESVRATLSGNIESLRNHYKITLTGEAADWLVGLTPKSDKVGELVEEITIRGNESKIRVIETRDPDGDESRLVLTYQMIK